ncbi:MAG TPA: DUF1080 domain-containing protein [Blastocatellia bacterium]|jgi:hypothetical protein|nr:DUF1080 domain-containing protein [Blastocatellia bacterium]
MDRLKAIVGGLRVSGLAFILSLSAFSGVVMNQTIQELSPYPPPKNAPSIITPGTANSDPPSDAVVLFNGSDLSKWRSVKDGGDARWQIKDGYMEVAPGTGDIATREGFGDCQLHIEWAAPSVVKGEDQGRGNSGVFLMERYEVQVLDSYNNVTYYHGQAGAIYKQYAPLVNASRKPGEWQAYDIIFKAPKFDEQGKVTERARITVLHNGVLIQNNVEIHGNTWHDKPPLYLAHGPKASVQLQDHGDLVRFRNVWIRPL